MIDRNFRPIDFLVSKNNEITHKILSGQMKKSQENTTELSMQSKKILKHIGKHIKCTSKKFVGDVNVKKNIRENSPTKKASSILEISIKDMPKFDPDSEVSSLSLTIPSWISLINRTQSVTDFNLISDKAKKELTNRLDSLKDTTDVMLSLLKE